MAQQMVDNPIRDSTPAELIAAFQSLSGCIFLTTNALTTRVREVSDYYGCRYVARSTGPSRSMQLYCCRHYTSIYNCRACVRFTYDAETHKVRFESCDIEHSHKIGAQHEIRARNQLTMAVKERIQNATKQGFSAHSIRFQEGLTCSKDVLYAARREELQLARRDEMKRLIDEMKSWKDWTNVVRVDEKNQFNGCYVFHDSIMGTPYASDVCILDDTSCTNYYGLPLLVLLSEDENARSQVLAYALMMSRVKACFVDFFEELSRRIGAIRVFVSDRNKTQIDALKQVFQDCAIIYCSVHIGRNIKQKACKDIKTLYSKMKRGQVSEHEFLSICTEYSTSATGTKPGRFIAKLLDEKDHWLPTLINPLGHCDNDTTNRVEGFFGTLKCLTEHKRGTLADLVRAVYLRAERLFVLSKCDKRISLSEELISAEDQERLGVFCLAFVGSEYEDMKELGVSDVSYSDSCCHNHMLYRLPCRHLLLERLRNDCSPLLTLDDIPTRWHRTFYNPSLPSQVTMISTQRLQEPDWAYTSCIDKFEKYFTAASHSRHVQEILAKTLDELGSIEHQSDAQGGPFLPPPSLLLSGTSATRPSRNVDHTSGARRKRKKYRCSRCGSDQHTAPRCPKNNLPYKHSPSFSNKDAVLQLTKVACS